MGTKKPWNVTNIITMKVRDVMTQHMIVLSTRTSYEEAARILYGNKTSGAPVVDSTGRIAGILSEKDLFRAMFPKYGEYLAEPHVYRDQELQEERVIEIRHESIGKYMTSPAIVVDADAPILRAGGLLLAYGLHRLPVMEAGRLVGIVTREEIFQTILQRRLFSAILKVENMPRTGMIIHR